MIISCPNCNKKFNIDEKLIPEQGRLLQCSSCNHKWHYIIPKTENEIVENIDTSNKSNYKVFINPTLKEKKNINQKINKNKIKNKNLNEKNKIATKNVSLGSLLNNLIIILISFIALILILDTFKGYITNFFPILIPLLDNLYLSISDLISFVKDLFN